MSQPRWLAQHQVDGALAFRIGVDDSDLLVAEWIGIARLTSNRTGTESRFEALADVNSDVLARTRGSAACLLRQLSGDFAFHGSCVSLGQGAFLLTGRSGAGKSTLAAWLVHHTGAQMLSDDLAPVNRTTTGSWRVQPFESVSWLDGPARAMVTGIPDEAPTKRPLVGRSIADGSVPLAAVIELAFDDECNVPELTAITGASAIALLLLQSVRFVIDEPARQRRELDALVTLASSIPILRLKRQRNLRGLESSAEEVRALSGKAMVLRG